MKAEASWESCINILSNRDTNLQLYRPGNILPFRLFGALCLADHGPEDIHSWVKFMTPCPCPQSFSSCCHEIGFFFFETL